MFATRETDRLIIRPYSLIHSSAKLGNNRQQALIILMTGRPVHRIAFAFAPAPTPPTNCRDRMVCLEDSRRC
jgi:hypothetical protein